MCGSEKLSLAVHLADFVRLQTFNTPGYLRMLRLPRLSPSRAISLDLLQTFVVVGDRMSITKAADALCVTQSAISRQVRSLEEALSVQLLVRGHRSIRFTPEGEKLYLAVRGPLAQIVAATESFGDARVRASVSITTSIGIAGLWLLPRLGAMQSAFPDLDIKVIANNQTEDLQKSGADLALRYCASGDAPLRAGHVSSRKSSRRCARRISLAMALFIRKSFSEVALLEFDGEFRPWLHWETWLAHFGWSSARPKRVLRYNQYDQLIHAAIAGQGIALGRINLLRQFIANGQLNVLQMPGPGPSNDHGYWLITAEASPRAEVARVAQWLQVEGGHTSP
jgi:LysR family glycine cleavage system transcriptional activator